jgi:hypothetical protein
MILEWIKCNGQQWCDFMNLNLDHPHFNNLGGVYIIWHGGPTPHVVRVGQGIIKDRLRAHQSDQEIIKYQNNSLYVTWAEVPLVYRDGVERHLAEKWGPLVGARFPEVPSIEVNSPWAN